MSIRECTEDCVYVNNTLSPLKASLCVLNFSYVFYVNYILLFSSLFAQWLGSLLLVMINITIHALNILWTWFAHFKVLRWNTSYPVLTLCISLLCLFFLFYPQHFHFMKYLYEMQKPLQTSENVQEITACVAVKIAGNTSDNTYCGRWF